MALFPEISPDFYDSKGQSIKQEMSKHYNDSISINQAFWTEADIDARFEAGDQTVWSEVYNYNVPLKQRQFSFNRIKRIVNMISGYQRKNRMSTTVVPIENGDQQTAEQFSKIIQWSNNQNSVYETISEAFNGALITGMNLLQVWVDYRSDPVSGSIRVDNCSYNSFLLDPFFRKTDLSDCNALWKRVFVTKPEALSLLPGKKEEIEKLSGADFTDNKFEFMPEQFAADKKKRLTYDEYYYRTYRTQKILIDSNTGEVMEWTSENEEGLSEFLSTYPSITVSEVSVPTVNLAILLQGVLMYDGRNPMGIDRYPFVPVFGYYSPDITYFPLRVQGVVRGLRDSQFLYNRRKVIELDMLESQVNSGWKFKENALVNPRDVFNTGQGKGIAIKADAQMTDAEKIAPAQIPPSFFQLSESLSNEIQQISGVNEELLGSAVDEKAGILSMLRQGAGLTTLQSLFDNLDTSQKQLGKIMIDVIQNNFTPGKVKRIIEDEPAPQFYNKAFGKYDAAIEQGFNTTTQKQMGFAQLLQLKETGIEVPTEALLEAATVQNKTKLMEVIQKQQEQQQKAEEERRQLELEELKSRTNLAHARSQADYGLGVERMSRVQENKQLAVERRSQAEENRQGALLDTVKALKELDDIDITQLQKLISLSKMLKDSELAQQSQTEDRQTAAQAQTVGQSQTVGQVEGIGND